MTSSQRIVVNTAAQYTRTVINVCLSLYSTRLILAALGENDYGIYSLVAGVVMMLSFITNAMVTTTQRFLSYSHGQQDKEKLHTVFGNSLLLHVFVGLVILLILACAQPLVVHKLNIETSRMGAANIVYIAAAGMLLLSIITAPYRALYIARENIVYISVIDVLDGILKVLIAIGLTYLISLDKLILYAALMTGISIFNLLAFSCYAHAKFEECHIPRLKEFDREFIQDISKFIGWNLYGTGCIISRTQGISIIVNHFAGTAINAAYGVAQQVQGSLGFIAYSILNAIAPQITKAESRGERGQMLNLAGAASKYATLLLSLVCIPIIFEMQALLEIWLGNVPAHAIAFCRFILIAAVFDQMTIGLTTANQAIGDIRRFTFAANTIKLLSLPLAYVFLRTGFSVDSVMWAFCLGELGCSLSRIPLIKKCSGLNGWKFIKQNILPVIPPVIVEIGICYVICHTLSMNWRFIPTGVLAIAGTLPLVYLISLTKDEKQYVRQSIQTIYGKIRKNK